MLDFNCESAGHLHLEILQMNLKMKIARLLNDVQIWNTI